MSDCSSSEHFSLEDYFDENSWNTMSNYEKRIYSNKLRNYDVMCQMGLNPPKPSFMLSAPKARFKKRVRRKNNARNAFQKKASASRPFEIPKQMKTNKETESTQSHSRNTNINYGFNKPENVFSSLIPRTEKHLRHLIHLKALLEKYSEIENCNDISHETEK